MTNPLHRQTNLTLSYVLWLEQNIESLKECTHFSVIWSQFHGYKSTTCILHGLENRETRPWRMLFKLEDWTFRVGWTLIPNFMSVYLPARKANPRSPMNRGMITLSSSFSSLQFGSMELHVQYLKYERSEMGEGVTVRNNPTTVLFSSVYWALTELFAHRTDSPFWGEPRPENYMNRCVT